MKTYKILTLGASGAGKTVFLASMFKSLSIQREHGFSLEVEDDRERKILNAIYTKLIAGGIWPKGTKYSEISEWTYTCRVKNPNLDKFQVCQFTYFDYAGGRFTDMDEDDTELKDTIKQADTILGLLDGQKIRDLMTNQNQVSVNAFVTKDLQNIIKWMFACRVPIHFVVSKWDLLENNFSLKQIRNRLLEIPQIKELIRKRNQEGYPVRLIPVSSVGSGFAIPEPDGSMRKISGSIPHPFQVEVPIACVLPDEFKAKLSEVAKQREKLGKQGQNIGKLQTFLDGLDKVTSALTLGLKVAIEGVFIVIPPPFNIVGMSKPIFEKLLTNSLGYQLKKIKKSTQEISEMLRQTRDASLEMVKNKETALEHAIDSFLYIQNELSRRFPESEIFLE